MGAFGQKLKSLRIEGGLTLREYCRILDKDVGNLSKLERGLLPPPKNEDSVIEFCQVLGFGPDSEEARELIALAAAETGVIPKSLMNDEELIEKLPIFFRTVDGKKLEREKLLKFLDKLREA